MSGRDDRERPVAEDTADSGVSGAPDTPAPAGPAEGPGAASGHRPGTVEIPLRYAEPTETGAGREPAGGEPAGDTADVSRETSAAARLAQEDTPIAHAAATAVAVLGGQTGRLPRPASTRILTVANQKGGVGKTTSAVNLAAALALHGLQVLVIDLDPQGNASTALGIDHHADVPSIYDVLIEGRPMHEVVVPVAAVPGLTCAPATIDLAGAEIELVSLVARESRLDRAVQAYLGQRQAAGDRVDFVLIDCPPSLGLLTVNAFVAAREVLIPIQCEYYALEGLGQLLRNVDLVQAHLNPALTVSTILLTMHDARTRLAAQVAEEVRDHFGDVVLRTAIPRSVRVSEAPSYAQTVLTYDPGSTGALSYLEAARELAARAGPGQPPPTPQEGVTTVELPADPARPAGPSHLPAQPASGGTGRQGSP